MRSNYQHTRQIPRLIEDITSFLRKAKVFISIGVEGKAWLASFLICAMLLPVFSPPARASAPVIRQANAIEFEPVNEQLPFWTRAWRNLNVKLESWAAAVRNERISGDDDSDDEKKNAADKKKKGKKGDAEEEKKPNAENAEPDAPVPAIPPKEKNNLKSEAAKPEEKTAPAVSTNLAPKNIKNKSAAVSPAPFVNQLPSGEQESVYSAENNLGSPFGQTEMDSKNGAAALRIRHRAGIANFNFDLALAALSGRGIDAGVALNYNSRVWNESTTLDQNNNPVPHFTYDVEQSWIAPGFSSGLGYLESRAQVRNVIYSAPHNSWHTEIVPLGLTDPDGTRHQLRCKSSSQIPGAVGIQTKCDVYATTDGTFIEFAAKPLTANPNNSWFPDTGNYSQVSFSTTYPNGTKIWYSAAFGSGESRKHYPLVIQDSNGNRIRIAYKPDQSGRIDYIRDTLNRDIKFYYGTDGNNNPDKLVAVTIPGMSDNEEIQTTRFYYETMTLQSGGFVGSAAVTAPTAVSVLKYVYMPTTKTGYKYEYHPYYGMIKKITRLYGMQGSTSSVSQTGTITAEGVWAAKTEYDYPDGSAPQENVPRYTKRTDDWKGRTSPSPSETFYDVPEPAGVEQTSTVTVKDNGFDVAYQSVSHNTNDWKNGLIKETSVKKIYGPAGQFSALMSKTVYFWDPGQASFGGRQNPKLAKVEITDDAGLTRAAKFEYDQYNNQTAIEEYDFAAPGSLGALLRRTETEYETGEGWIRANLKGLVKSVRTIVGGVTVSKTGIEYDHNGSDATITRRGDIDTETHSTFYNPDQPARTETICPNDPPSVQSNGCITIYHPGYSAASAYRGNVTKVTRFSDATLTSDPNSDVSNYKHDIAGNLVEATLSCCQVKTFAYHKDHEYAFAVSETRGSPPAQMITSATYNRNTSLILSSTDENNQITNYQYEADTLREKKAIYPNGGYIQVEYSDKLVADASDLVPSFVRETTTLDANKTTQSYTYFNGDGAEIRNAVQTPDGWNISAADFDHLGRTKKSYNPFYAATPNATIPDTIKFTEVVGYDALNRATQVKLPDETNVNSYFNEAVAAYIDPDNQERKGIVSRITDQAGKERRRVADSLGRVIRVDEPTAAGLGSLATPNQPTHYYYDGNNNLVRVLQSDGTTTQERKFKYDALSRLTHEKLVESNPTLDDNGIKGAPAPTRWTKVLKYNADSLLTEGIDARGVKTTLSYDGLNRISTVSYSGETGYQTPAVNYFYDQARAGFFNKGALTRVETAAAGDTPSTATEFDYDLMGRIRKHRQSIGTQTYNLEYAYNLAGQLISETYPSGKIVTVDYDANGRLSGVADQTRSYMNNPQYQGKGNALSSINSGNGTTQTFQFNDRLQMTNQTLLKGAEVLQKYDYSYGQLDASGNIIAGSNNGQLAKIESHIGAAKQWTKKFAYDSLGRLSKEEEFRGDNGALVYRNNYSFDRFGNLYRKQSNNPNSLSSDWIEDSDISKATNRLTSFTSHDDAGNTTTDGKFRSMSFAYDANWRMVRASRANTPDALSVYDALGKRVAEKTNNIWRFLIYDMGGNLVSEYGGAQSSDPGGVKYLFTDWQGSTRAIINQGGFVQARMDYQAFGEEINSGVGLRTAAQGFGSGQNLRQKYSLTESDEATGLGHTWWRKNEQRAGRWTSPDPYNGSASIGNPQSWNRFAYVENQPTNYSDPSGLYLTAVTRCFNVPTYFYINGEFDSVEFSEICYQQWEWNDQFEIGGGVGDPASPEDKCGLNPISRQPGIRDDKPDPKTGLREGGKGNVRPGAGGNGGFRERTGGKHDGTDIAAPVGTQFVASMSGRVVKVVDSYELANTAAARRAQNGGYGNAVTIQYDNGTYGYYAHLTKVYAVEGARIEQGARVGSTGRTGNANNDRQPPADDHLHYGRFTGPINAKGRPVNKSQWINPVKSLNSPCP
jgi:RHS repeat-associated protein